MSNKAAERSIYDAFGPGGLLGAKAELDRTGHLSSEELAIVLEANPDEPLPDWFRDYLVRRLRGQARKPTGPRPASQDIGQQTLLLLARQAYKRAHHAAHFLIANRRRIAASRRDKLPKAEATASELALAYVQERYGLYSELSPGRLHNLLTGRSGERSRGSQPKPRDVP